MLKLEKRGQAKFKKDRTNNHKTLQNIKNNMKKYTAHAKTTNGSKQEKHKARK